MNKLSLNQIAVHEAAHAVAALGHGIGVLHISLDRREVVLEPPGDCLERGHHHGAIAVGYAVTALAGEAAAPATGLSRSDELLLDRALFLGSWLHPPDEMRRAFSALAASFVHDHRDAIKKLAIVLDQGCSLSGTEVEKIVGSMGDARQP